MKNLTLKQIGVILFITLGAILAFSPIQNGTSHDFDPAKLANEINARNDHITAEQLGHLIIDKDPDYQLIDLRSSEEYEKFHIKSSMNIPLESLFAKDNLDFIDPEKLVVLYTNGGTHAAQAWVMLQQMGYTNTTVLLGGLNYWVDVYSNPTPPENIYADSEIFNYQFKVSAGNYLMGNQQATNNQPQETTAPKISFPKRKKKAKSADEGC